jgi:hypothetical protein
MITRPIAVPAVAVAIGVLMIERILVGHEFGIGCPAAS